MLHVSANLVVILGEVHYEGYTYITKICDYFTTVQWLTKYVISSFAQNVAETCSKSTMFIL